jgi:hypothetical protein
VGELGGDFADGGHLFTLDEPAALLGDGGVGFFDLSQDGAHVLTKGFKAGATGRDFDADALGGGRHLKLKLIDRTGDAAGDQKADEQAGDHAKQAAADKQRGVASQGVLDAGALLTGLGGRGANKLFGQVNEIVELAVDALMLKADFFGLTAPEAGNHGGVLGV